MFEVNYALGKVILITQTKSYTQRRFMKLFLIVSLYCKHSVSIINRILSKVVSTCSLQKKNLTSGVIDVTNSFYFLEFLKTSLGSKSCMLIY